MEKNIVAGHYDRQPYTQSLPTCYLVTHLPFIGYIPGVHLFVIYFNKFAHSYTSLIVLLTKYSFIDFLSFDTLGTPKKNKII